MKLDDMILVLYYKSSEGIGWLWEKKRENIIILSVAFVSSKWFKILHQCIDVTDEKKHYKVVYANSFTIFKILWGQFDFF